MSKNFEEIKKLIDSNIPDDYLIKILFDINRYFDKSVTLAYQRVQKDLNCVFNSVDRKALRTYFYYQVEEVIANLHVNNFPTIDYTQNDIDTVIDNTIERINKYDSKKIIDSIKERYSNLIQHRNSSISHMSEWLEYYNKKRENLFDYSSFILRITDVDFRKNNFNLNYLYDIIKNTYLKLENYRHLIIFIDGQIHDETGRDITWQVAYKLTIYAENFVQYSEKYFPCKKEEQIRTLKEFLSTRINGENTFAEEFYKSISTGYKFEDCFISDNQNKIIITLKKITLDESPIPCPSCLTTIQAGNSYPEMFLRSYECKNPSCQDRSKSGRGKRFDEYGVYRNSKLEENNPNNRIDTFLYSSWRRDIFDDGLNPYEMLIKYYSWNDENILVYNVEPINETYSRKIINYLDVEYFPSNKYIDTYESLPIFRLFQNIHNAIEINIGNSLLVGDIEIVCGNSSEFIATLKPEQIGSAITSPPYYNAREYSQWSNMLLYYVDVLINTKTIYECLHKNGKYLYNIGDIVCEDNVYVRSKMSNRRLPLGFLSCMIFEIAGFKLKENIIWDKGQVQSKRNSTVNLFSGYVKCINCYEHVFVFSKDDIGNNSKKVAQINPVIKINSKGENTYKHTAPYPLELVELIRPYLIKGTYVLDPYLGSGTTLKWCHKNNKKGIGIELNKKYFELCNKYIFDD